jgi:hypothetical protein
MNKGFIGRRHLRLAIEEGQHRDNKGTEQELKHLFFIFFENRGKDGAVLRMGSTIVVCV